MLSLWIDTHSQDICLALLEDGKLLKKKIVKDKIDHSRISMPSLILLMKEENKEAKDIQDIVVVNGPGSFTGERLGVTIAKVLAYTLNVPIRTISSIETSVASQEITDDTYFILEEKNGYFVSLYNKDKQVLKECEYYKKDEFERIIKGKNTIYCKDYDIEKSYIYAHQRGPLNPHEVNPYYVKKLEVEK